MLAIATTEVISIVYDNLGESNSAEKIKITESYISFFLRWPFDESYLRQYQEIGGSKSITLEPHDNIRVVEANQVYWLKLQAGQFKSSVYDEFINTGKVIFPVINVY